MHLPVALHTIGQTPRPDLTPFITAAVNARDVTVTGAMDGLGARDIPEPIAGDFPLETRLSDGTRVETGISFLEPRLQSEIDRLDDKARLHLILCAGPFPNLHSEGLLLRPFEYACEVFSERNFSKLLVVVPFAAQAEPSKAKWENAGFMAQVRSMDERPAEIQADTWLSQIGSTVDCDAFVLDYVGYSKGILDSVNDSLPIPVFDLGFLAAEFARDVIEEYKGLSDE